MSDQNNEHHGGYYTGDVHNQFVPEHYDPKNRKKIWTTFWILLAVTIFEVAIAFTSLSKELLMWTFVLLTIVKSGYIVGIFMHLKSEKKSLQYSILLPFLLIVYFIAMAIAEGNYLHKMF
ncbi:MAG: cytochrome C oxidase subunit IV family protein [Bacteroidetes bacterium]|nr:cytochrome C oxidase subunit IV family protein [Bacteroidota bacterium]HNR19967.1 cytochrome C oxidase subunit IV family protein [Bacteroidia bacterium]HNU33995.1 cytochrome C oxidase subunit IV family protein [Bacteroidia bacterium]